MPTKADLKNIPQRLHRQIALDALVKEIGTTPTLMKMDKFLSELGVNVSMYDAFMKQGILKREGSKTNFTYWMTPFGMDVQAAKLDWQNIKVSSITEAELYELVYKTPKVTAAEPTAAKPKQATKSSATTLDDVIARIQSFTAIRSACPGMTPSHIKSLMDEAIKLGIEVF